MPVIYLKDTARVWLLSYLADGPKLSKDLLAEAYKRGYTTKPDRAGSTLTKLCNELGIIRTRTRVTVGARESMFEWRLPQ